MEDNQQENRILLNMEIEDLINDFFYKYFANMDSILDFNNKFIEENGFSYKTKINYMQLSRFVTTTYNTMVKVDPSFNYSLLSKFNKDIVTLSKLYKQFATKHQDISTLYEKKFLSHFNGIETIVKKLEHSDKDLELFDDIDQLNSYIKQEFLNQTTKEIESYKIDLKKIINTKYYYFDHLLSFEAKKSDSIKAFYKDSLGKKVISTKLYIEQYLKSVDKDNTNLDKLHTYLHNVVKVMD